jgi:pyruvate formate lyase activating enzyme
MTTGRIHSFDLSTGVDGPGTRFVAFLAGCPLRCLYCHSPDTWWARNGQISTVDSLLAEVTKYHRFIALAGGGVTVSGREPLQQHKFTGEFLHRCKEAGLHTALDTCGAPGAQADERLLDATDLVLLDIKSFDPQTYRRVTQTGRVASTLRFAQRLSARGTPMWIRFVLVPGITDAADNIAGLARFAATLQTVERVEILPFHRLGAHKYAELNLTFPLSHLDPPSAKQLRQAGDLFREHGLPVEAGSAIAAGPLTRRHEFTNQRR